MKKTLNECLDLVLQTLVDNYGLLCLYEFENMQGYLDRKFTLSPSFQKLHSDIGLSNKEFKQLLEILQSQGYATFTLPRAGGSPNTQDIDVKNIETNEAGNHFFSNITWVGPDKIELTLKGKFHILNGGFQGEENAKNAEKSRIKKQDEQIRLLTLLLAIGSIGVLIIEALKFILDYWY